MTTNNSVNTCIVPTASNEVTKPSQTAYLGIRSSTLNNVTGAGVTYTIVYNSEIFDQNSDFNLTNFVAPVDGMYFLLLGVELGDLAAGHTWCRICRIQNLHSTEFDGAVRNPSNNCSNTYSVFVDMDASDSWGSSTYAANGAGVVDLNGSASPLITYYGGYLAT